MRKQKGFTLIELLLVLAIIGIIAAIAIPALLGQRSRARDKASISNMTGTLSDLLGAYDRATEAGANPLTGAATGGGAVAPNLGMQYVIQQANLHNMNPWNTSQVAFVDDAGAFTTAGVNTGQVGYVYAAPVPATATPGTLTGNVLVQNQVAGAAGTGPYNVTKVSNIE